MTSDASSPGLPYGAEDAFLVELDSTWRHRAGVGAGGTWAGNVVLDGPLFPPRVPLDRPLLREADEPSHMFQGYFARQALAVPLSRGHILVLGRRSPGGMSVPLDGGGEVDEAPVMAAARRALPALPAQTPEFHQHRGVGPADFDDSAWPLGPNDYPVAVAEALRQADVRYSYDGTPPSFVFFDDGERFGIATDDESLRERLAAVRPELVERLHADWRAPTLAMNGKGVYGPEVDAVAAEFGLPLVALTTMAPSHDDGGPGPGLIIMGNTSSNPRGFGPPEFGLMEKTLRLEALRARDPRTGLSVAVPRALATAGRYVAGELEPDAVNSEGRRSDGPPTMAVTYFQVTGPPSRAGERSPAFADLVAAVDEAVRPFGGTALLDNGYYDWAERQRRGKRRDETPDGPVVAALVPDVTDLQMAEVQGGVLAQVRDAEEQRRQAIATAVPESPAGTVAQALPPTPAQQTPPVGFFASHVTATGHVSTDTAREMVLSDLRAQREKAFQVARVTRRKGDTVQPGPATPALPGPPGTGKSGNPWWRGGRFGRRSR